jgi:TPR repeat protein
MKTISCTILCVLVINSIALADDIEIRLKNMEIGRDNFFKHNGTNNSEIYYSENCSKQLSFWQQAAQQNQAIAQSLLAGCYAYGKGVAKDEYQAFEWFRQAAEKGDVNAQTNLGYLYAHGMGVTQDKNQAITWIIKAAEQGYFFAEAGLAHMYATGNMLPKNETQAVIWFSKAAEQQDAGSEYNLAVAYMSGRGVAQNIPKAMGWLCKAAKENFFPAQKTLKQLSKNHSNFGSCQDSVHQ